ncbi:MAG TPA: glyoxylate/hydroxypyruvate reductase A [Geminicoccaceae bacterium]
MRVVFHCPWANARGWLEVLRAAGPELHFAAAEEIDEPGEVEAAVVWNPPVGFFDPYPNLRIVSVLGAGADYLFVPGMRLPEVPITRIVDPVMTERMAGWVLATTLHFHRQLDRYLVQQRERRWLRHEHPDFGEVRIGILGQGAMGSASARLLAGVGYRVAGWSRTPKALPGIESFAGDEALAPFLARTDVLVCLLPLTPATRGILRASTFGALAEGAIVLNAGRGAHLVEDDLLDALASGRLRGAALDVFAEEPLPVGHPFWTHPQILLTPHVASLTNPRTGAEQVVAAIRAVRDGREPSNRIDPGRAY